MWIAYHSFIHFYSASSTSVCSGLELGLDLAILCLAIIIIILDLLLVPTHVTFDLDNLVYKILQDILVDLLLQLIGVLFDLQGMLVNVFTHACLYLQNLIDSWLD